MCLPLRLSVFALLLLIPVGIDAAADAQRNDKSGPAEKTEHQHRPIVIPGDPILTPVKVELQRPRRVVVDGKGNLLIADSAAGKVFKVDAKRQVKTLAPGLSAPSGLCLGKDGTLYVSNHADGTAKQGSVVRVAADGKQTVVAKELTGPKGMAIGPDGKLYVALFDDNRIVRIGPRGKVDEFCKNVPTPAAVCFDSKGFLYAVNSAAGTVTKISSGGKASVHCRGLSVPSDVSVSPEGDILATNYGGTSIDRILPDGTTEPYLTVPRGTIGLCFDRGGNVFVVNWDLQLAVHIRNRMLVPCPHCQKRIPLRIKPKPKRKKKRKPVI